MSNPHEYSDSTLLDTLRETGAPRILTARSDGNPVYVALDAEGNLIEVSP